MDKKHPNIIDMEKYGKVLRHDEGYGRIVDMYLAFGLIETSEKEYLIWKLCQPLDYGRLKDAEYRWSEPYIDASWDDKKLALADYKEWLEDIDSDMTYDEMVDNVENIVEYEGQQYGRNVHGDWEPNY